MKEEVILVNEMDQEVGKMEKQQAHEIGLLHRAISVFLFNPKGELLLQKRASSKYHSGGLWTNTCCSHPRPGEKNIEAAIRRLYEEMGICSGLDYSFSFTYTAHFENGLIENEFDHVFTGISKVIPQLNIEEAEDFDYVSIPNIIIDMDKNPNNYTEWFKIAIHKVDFQLKKEYLENKL
ncbi:MAG: Isopentenyl-diphosphate Delta-isomerase [Flavobacteriaceae bacterium]|nr:MAG: Isopentenyl-diphosphate Delta-isomerase [Flavobacteriaceae bacterium]|tara:strand:+ start:5541 stop:6077 length:537 start_codon:yes stop_codon:yes gene_type:complete